jgi:CheY-like chemotaxis protein
MLMLGILAVGGLWWVGTVAAAEAAPGEEAAGAPGEEAAATGYGAAGLSVDVAPADLQHDWRLMVHYFKIARFDLAAQHAQKVIDANPDPATVLALVESPTTGYDLVVRMLRPDAMAEVAPKILALAEEGARAKKTDTARIQENLLKLDKGPRPYFLAMKELRYSGPYVVPHALAILQDPARKDLHPFVQRSLTDLGSPVVRPLVRALATPNANLKEMVIEILGNIGHPNALPALKAVVENPDSSEGAKRAASNAVIKIADESMLQTPAKRLYLDLANKYYYDKIPVADKHQPTTDVFDWVAETGLLYRPAPSNAVNEILASRACSDALKTDPGALAAVALWVSSVMQMEAELEGQTAREADPFLPDDMPSVDFFARAVGQQHLYSVLDRALRDRNTPVAVRACRALEDTANEEFLDLYAETKAGSPLVMALTYPDQRVRFAAAFALAAIRPTEPFTGAGKVIPTLSEALNLEAAKSILLVEPTDDNRNRLQADLKNEGWNVVTASTGNDAISKARAMPRVDAVVISSRTQNVGHADVVSMLRGDYHTAMTPIVVLSWPDDPVKASWFEQRVPFIQAVDHNLETAALMEQVTALKKEAGSLVLDEEAARAMSLEAAEVLKRIALASRVYSAKRARQSLLDGLTNRPDALVISVLGALAEIADAEITRAMADVAVNAERAKPVRVAALQNLARAARFVGNELSDEQVSALQEMAGETDDDLRDAAGEALGALDLDAAEGAEIILQHGAH